MAPNLSKVVAQDESTTPKKSRDILIKWSRAKKKRYISIFTMPIAQIEDGRDLG